MCYSAFLRGIWFEIAGKLDIYNRTKMIITFAPPPTVPGVFPEA